MRINDFESVAVIDTRDKELTSLVRRVSLSNLLVRTTERRSLTLPAERCPFRLQILELLRGARKVVEQI